MRRVAALVILLLMCFSVSFAEEIDFSNMSLDQLFELKISINQEIAKRYGEGWEELVPGEYFIGKEIKSGRYEVLGIKTYGNYTNICFRVIDPNNREKYVYSNSPSIGESFVCVLEEGTILKIFDGVLLIREAPKSKYAP